MTEENLYAIIETGGKQYRVSKGDVIDVELLGNEKADIEFEKILFFSNGSEVKVGAPYLEKSSVKAAVIDEVKGPKVYAFKYKRRKSCHRKVGHRQNYSRVQINEISVSA
ncbi:50S ribosomal protein L21 [Chlamydiales bacterium SCGC AB-751-O23]|jgi:large subunit ribosomal protein L21|nr:50S ribosomal protein L21 [Chlamydiales bacterium SCGC AB-751-O23]